MSTFLIDDDDLPRVPLLLRLVPCGQLRVTVYAHEDVGTFSVYAADRATPDEHVFLFVLSRTSDHSAEHFSHQIYNAAVATPETVETAVRAWFDLCLPGPCPTLEVVFYSEETDQQQRLD